MASNNAPNTEDTFTFLSDGYTQVQYIPLTNISNVSTTAASSDQGTIQTILQELRSLQTKFEKFEETNTKIIKTLTEEVVALKTEVKQQRNMREKGDTSLIPSLPFTDVKDFIDFDTKLLLNDKMTSQLMPVIPNIRTRPIWI
ncbi:uncharacterized protein LOC125779335 [Bactrocera dorsalis]|uniref:Uncharacterized protein LOC125779335 n=1 Tax=Bactrocera dorsalis TaxID=27457 RepID=A0ABM3K544_BACDO|nr:uncharacterized protein LOC125779335 [Bactrocera dorsalis]